MHFFSKESLVRFIYFHPFLLSFSHLLIVCGASFLLATWGARRFFSELSFKKFWLRSFLSILLYLICFSYFFVILLILPDTILDYFNFPLVIRNRALFSIEDAYFIGILSVFLIGGGIFLFFWQKKNKDIYLDASLSFWRRFFKGIKISFLIALILTFVFELWRIPVLSRKEKVKEEVAKIHSLKITHDDVMGKNLPPEPDPSLKDATIEGIDANHNGIRDDVELAIFKEYPNSAKIRAALLQYAFVRQMEMTQELKTPETVTAVAEQDARANDCLRELTLELTPTFSELEKETILEKLDSFRQFVESKHLNTSARKKAQDDFYKNNLRSYGTPTDRPVCDVDLSSLPN